MGACVTISTSTVMLEVKTMYVNYNIKMINKQ